MAVVSLVNCILLSLFEHACAQNAVCLVQKDGAFFWTPKSLCVGTWRECTLEGQMAANVAAAADAHRGGVLLGDAGRARLGRAECGAQRQARQDQEGYRRNAHVFVLICRPKTRGHQILGKKRKVFLYLPRLN